MLLLSRSGLACKGITTQGGVIDADYRGEVQCILYNATDEDFPITKGQRISQGLLLPVYNVNWEEVDNLPEPAVAHAGFGSTDQH